VYRVVKVIVPKRMDARRIRRRIFRFEYGPWKKLETIGGVIKAGSIFLFAAGLHMMLLLFFFTILLLILSNR
jgi:hypothetical protein